ncbi:FAD-dependent oxidoreductase [Platysternon megacephalum]|uniref:Triosephosphate isomerase n=1 Tax=Platysternon megacephalum TaxID=55544 RepID=A0A4D9DFE1_9SAUR|nr:FAD-dependent oxidoreductase [Platysternon megacephalum]
MLKKLGCTYVVIGHSERREYHGEADDVVNAKALAVLANGMTPIICVGEGLDVRQANEHVRYTVDQVRGALKGFTAEQVSQCVIAYEPVWAIGTGEVASAADAQEVCGAIRGVLVEDYGQASGDVVRVLYGGSVKADNIVELMSQDDVDGALVGGASLKPDEFAAIVRFYDFV